MSGTQQLLAAPVQSQTWCLTSSPPSSPALDTENESSSRSPPATGDTQTADDENPHLECFPTDRANFAENTQDDNIKRYILKMGPYRPKGPFPTDKDIRCFSEICYTSTTKVGMKLPCSWMCYSPKLDCCYCETWWLFAN